MAAWPEAHAPACPPTWGLGIPLAEKATDMRPPGMRIPVDHLVYATSNLERGMEEIERLTGVPPTLGGQHPGRGTR